MSPHLVRRIRNTSVVSRTHACGHCGLRHRLKAWRRAVRSSRALSSGLLAAALAYANKRSWQQVLKLARAGPSREGYSGRRCYLRGVFRHAWMDSRGSHATCSQFLPMGPVRHKRLAIHLHVAARDQHGKRRELGGWGADITASPQRVRPPVPRTWPHQAACQVAAVRTFAASSAGQASHLVGEGPRRIGGGAS